jgi:hypothetical protein
MLLGACGSSSPTGVATSTPGAAVTPGQATSAPTAGAATAGAPSPIALPDVTLEDIGGNAPVSGSAGFTVQGTDVAVNLELAGTSQLQPFPDEVAVFIVPGRCADVTQPPNVANAVASATVDVEGGTATEPVVVPLAAVTAAPHAILVTTAPGDINLACGDIG